MAPTGGSRSYEYDVFISYSRKDADFARQLHKALEGFGAVALPDRPRRPLSVFRDERDLVGSAYYASIDASLADSARLLVICSPNAASSDNP